MDEDKKKKFESELREGFNRHNCKNVSLCCDADEEFLGYISFENQKTSLPNVMASVINVGRLWQYSRQTTKELLDSFERLWGKVEQLSDKKEER